RQAGVELSQRLRGLFLDAGNLLGDIAAAGCQRAQFLDLGIEFGDRLFEVEVAAHVIRHSGTIGRSSGQTKFFGQTKSDLDRSSSTSRTRVGPAIRLFHGEACRSQGGAPKAISRPADEDPAPGS